VVEEISFFAALFASAIAKAAGEVACQTTVNDGDQNINSDRNIKFARSNNQPVSTAILNMPTSGNCGNTAAQSE